MRWEYRVETFLMLDEQDVLAALNSLGAIGWELVAFVPSQAQADWAAAKRQGRQKLYDELVGMNDPSPEDAFQSEYTAILKRQIR